jgi:hypothetical protein
MNWYQVFYWMSVADSVSTILGHVAVWMCVFGVACTIGYFLSSNALAEHAQRGGPENQSTSYNEWLPWHRAWKRGFTITWVTAVICLISWAFIPSKKQMIVIIAGGAIGNFVTTDSSSRAIPGELTRYVRNYLKNEADDLDVKTKEELGLATPKESFLNKAKNMTKEQVIEYLKNDTTVIR